MSEHKTNIVYEALEKMVDAIFVVEKKHILYQNEAAEKLLDQYSFTLEKILDVAEGKNCISHLGIECFQECEIKDRWDPTSFPINLLKKSNNEIEAFSGSFTLLSKQPKTWILSIRKITSQDRLQLLIQQKRLIDYVNQAHESERRFLSQELHDGFSQNIYHLMLEIRKTKWIKDTMERAKQLDVIDEGLNELLYEVKNMALDLRPTVLDDLGVVPAVQALIKRMSETTGMDFDFHTEISDSRYSQAIETVIYRVVQEAITNAIKYADTDTIFISLEEKGDFLSLEVKDCGNGFSQETDPIKGTGLGLLNMQERAESLGGSLKIESEKGIGTIIQMEIPLRLNCEVYFQ